MFHAVGLNAMAASERYRETFEVSTSDWREAMDVV